MQKPPWTLAEKCCNSVSFCWGNTGGMCLSSMQETWPTWCGTAPAVSFHSIYNVLPSLCEKGHVTFLVWKSRHPNMIAVQEIHFHDYRLAIILNFQLRYKGITKKKTLSFRVKVLIVILR